jgi:hypothetical protein
VRVRTFTGDFDELEALVRPEWTAQYGKRNRFDYSAPWMARFFGAPEQNRELVLEYRDAAGALTGFVGAAPRFAVFRGERVRLELVTLLTSSRKNHGLIAFELLREVFQRASAPGTFGIYNCCLAEDRTSDLLQFVSRSLKWPNVELASVSTLMGVARTSPDVDPASVRPARADEAEALARLVADAQGPLALARSVTREELRDAARGDSGARALVLVRGDAPIGVCLYGRRRLLGEIPTEVANLDVLLAPSATRDEARRFGEAIASDAVAQGATLLIGYQRNPALFPYAREAGLRLASRTLRVFVTPFSDCGETLRPGESHLFEIE